MPERVLEIGAGRHPAIANPGLLFTEHAAEYVGQDIYTVVEPTRSRIGQDYEIMVQIQKVICNAAFTPLASGSFDHVIYRSVFGQFTPSPNWPENRPPRQESHSFGAKTTFKWEDIIGSLAETLRLLRPLGRLCIAEEDTPVPAKILLPTIAKAGFTEIVYIDSGLQMDPKEHRMRGRSITGHPKWMEQRGTYWSNTEKSRFPYNPTAIPDTWDAPAISGSFGLTKPYIITARAPLK